MSDNPFSRLDKKRFPSGRPTAASPSPAVPTEAPPLDDAELFLRAMNGPATGPEDEIDFAASVDGREYRKKKPIAAALRASTSVSDQDSADAALFASAVTGCANLAQTASSRSRQEEQDKAQPANEPEDALFASAMAGVKAVNARGRDVPAQPTPPVPDFSAPSLESLLHKDVEFSVEFTDEYYEGHVAGLDPLVLAKLRAGQYSPEGHLDLHGMNLEQAYAALSRFVRDAYGCGKRHLLLITGRGKNSPGGDAVIRERVQTWLTRDPFKRVVLAFCTARQRDGGAGALYLLLRKRKKAHGKIHWDRVPSPDELLL